MCPKLAYLTVRFLERKTKQINLRRFWYWYWYRYQLTWFLYFTDNCNRFLLYTLSHKPYWRWSRPASIWAPHSPACSAWPSSTPPCPSTRCSSALPRQPLREPSNLWRLPLRLRRRWLVQPQRRANQLERWRPQRTTRRRKKRSRWWAAGCRTCSGRPQDCPPKRLLRTAQGERYRYIICVQFL